MRFTKLFLFSLIVLCLSTYPYAQAAGGTAYYVDQTAGNDNNNGQTWPLAKRTLQGAINAASKAVDLTSCTSWGSQINCVSLRRVESRFGNGDGIYTLDEQERALNTYYDSFFGSWRFYAPSRQVRLGFELKF